MRVKKPFRFAYVVRYGLVMIRICIFVSSLSSGAYVQRMRACSSCMAICVAPVAYQVILEPGVGQFREFKPRRVNTRMNSLGLLLVQILTCGKRESVI